MPTLYEFVKKAKIPKQELMDALEALAFKHRELGLPGDEVSRMLDRCDPPLTKGDLEMLKGYCHMAAASLERSDPWGARDWETVQHAVELLLR